ncbi:22885_t:CDS:1, partial [Racocetra persica]
KIIYGLTQDEGKKKNAEVFFDTKVTNAIITVLAYYDLKYFDFQITVNNFSILQTV